MIEVWAPRAERVRLRRAGHDDVELTRRTDATATRTGPADPTGASASGAGWWAADVDLAHGDEYGFVLGDGDAIRPDPRSRRQPHGVHAASVVDDPAAFAWTDASWTGRQLAGGLVYELHVGTFTPEGTFDAAIGRLAHLVELGVTHVELLPVNAFNGTWNWGYDGVLWYAVHEPYGGPEGYRRLVDAAHGAGLAVVQDVVYNHLGSVGNYLTQFGPYLRDGEGNTWGSSVNLDERAVRDYVLDNVRMWFEDFHVDGLRLDAVHALHESGDSPVHILAEIATASDAVSAHVGRPLTLIAESDLNDPVMILPREAGGYGLTAQWSDDWHHAVHVALTGETAGYYEDFAALDALPKAWTRGFFHDGTHSSFRGRDHGRPLPPDVPAWRLVTYAQDHDQVGNRAAGDRLSASLSTDRLAVAAVLTLTAPGTPMLFQGEEWGATTPWQFFVSGLDAGLAEATASGRVAEFAQMGWDTSVVPDPNDPATFERSKLDWTERDEPAHARLLDLYRRLARLRRERPELTDPDLAALSGEAADAPGGRVYALGRGAARVLVNLSAEPWEVARRAGDEVWLATTDVRTGEGTLVVPPDAAVVVGPAA